MSFCAKCGRRRDGDSRYCGGCGVEFEQSADEAAAAPDGVTRTDLAADVSRTDKPDAAPDPFASWYQPQAPRMPPGGLRDGAGEQWQPTETVQASPARPFGYPPSPAAPLPPPAPPFAPFPPGPPAGPPARDGRRGLFIVVAVVVVLAAGGGAYALASSLGKHSTAQPPTQPTVSAPASTGSSAASAPATAPGTGGSPTPSPALSLVTIAPGVPAGAAQSQVETLLSHYFEGINRHDYREYASTLSAAQQARQSQSTFSSGYGTTTDSSMTLTSLASTGNGLTATVTFTSHQAAAQSVDQHRCNDWTLNLYLVPQGSGYLIGPAPAGYRPGYADC